MNRPIPPGTVILIVDSDPITRIGMAAVLNTHGYECHCASDLIAARKAFDSLPLDLMICDAEMPGSGGVQLSRELHEFARLQDVPTILVVGSESSDSAWDAKCSTYRLRKPLDPDTLIDAVGKMLWMPHLIGNRLRQSHSHGSSVVPAPAAARRAGATDSLRR